MSYRVEIASTARAGCRATHCKKEGVKIKKGELRQGTFVTIQEHQTWQWRHWGCVTPTVMKNWKDTVGDDMDLVDGYDAIPEDAQGKVKRALEQVHVDDDDWNGDMECNRLNPSNKNQGMFVKTPKKKANKDTDDEDEAEPTPSKKKPAKKRGRAAQDDDDEDDVEPAPKKAKGRAKKAVKVEDDKDEPIAPPKKAGRGKKAAAASDEVDEESAPVAKKGKVRKAKSAARVVSDEDDPSAAEEKPAPAKKTKARKGTTKASNGTHGDDEAPKAKPQKRGRPKKAVVAEED